MQSPLAVSRLVRTARGVWQVRSGKDDIMNTIELQFQGPIQPLWDWRDSTMPVPTTITDVHVTHRIEGVGVVTQWSEEFTSAEKKLTITVESYQPIE